MESSWMITNRGESAINTGNNDYFIHNYFCQTFNYLESTAQKTDTARYLNELVMDMQELNEFELKYPGLLLHVHILLSTELNRVWNLLCDEQFDEQSFQSLENEWQSHMFDETNVTLQEKITLSKAQINDYVRIISNLQYVSLKRLENETNCQILIRGIGSLLDHRRESRLKNYPGWEHLSEPLHLLVRANDATITLCTMKLANGVQRVKQYLMNQ